MKIDQQLIAEYYFTVIEANKQMGSFSVGGK